MEDSSNGHEHATGEGHAPHPGMSEDVGLSYHAKRSLAIHELLVGKGVLGKDDLLRKKEGMEEASPANGGRVVARAWLDPDFRKRFLADPKGPLSELGYTLPNDADLAVVENTDKVHHLVVCTLCSCYPNWLLGPPPDWYKSLTYRSRAVSDPRGVMREFGLELEDGVDVRVVDSTADQRYMVLPRRPRETGGLNEDQLAKLVTRDSLIGVAHPRSPSPVPSAR